MTPRVAAVRALVAIFAGAEFDAALAAARADAETRNAPLVQELVYGTLRHYRELAARRDALLEHPGRLGMQPVALLLLVALYELAALATPAHAAVHQAVEASRELGTGWAAGLVNAVLRRALREHPGPLEAPPREEYPQWLQHRILRDWGGQAEAVFAAGLARPPLSLRVNRLRAARDEYLRKLAAADMGARPGAFSPVAVVLDEPRPVAEIPGFGEGLVSVQDEAAQLAVPLLAPAPGLRILDACAAPGGKTAHILEAEPQIAEVVAVDRDPRRLVSIQDNLRRLGLAATPVAGDAARPDAWWDRLAFDRVLLDAPCTATGVIRRHPDIRLRRRPGDADRAARRQRRLLAALWPLLAGGGRLVYAVCSLLQSEGDEVISDFLRDREDASPEPFAARWGQATAFGRRTAPGDSGMDGFYYAVIIKRRE